MATQVIKKDGQSEPFDAEKIKKAISMACQEGGCSEERKTEVVDQVSAAVINLADSKEEIATSEIREKILSELDSVEAAAASAWRKYEEERKSAQE